MKLTSYKLKSEIYIYICSAIGLIIGASMLYAGIGYYILGCVITLIIIHLPRKKKTKFETSFRDYLEIFAYWPYIIMLYLWHSQFTEKTFTEIESDETMFCPHCEQDIENPAYRVNSEISS